MNKYLEIAESQKIVPSMRQAMCCNTCRYLDSFLGLCVKNNVATYGDWLCDDHPNMKKEAIPQTSSTKNLIN